MGYDGVKTALAASKGEDVPADVDTGVNVITKANMNDDAVAGASEPEGQVSHGGRSCPWPRPLELGARSRASRPWNCASSTSGSPAPMR